MQPAVFNRIMRAPDWLRGRLRIALLRMGGAHIGRHCFIRNIDVPCDPWDLWIDDGVGLDNHVVLCLNGPRRDGPKIVIRTGSYINRYTVIDAFERVEVGRDCLIGPHCYIGDHARARVPGLPLGAGPLQGAPITLGDGVYVGAGAVITGGVTIGKAATIGAGAVVNRDVAAGDTVAGVPARSVAGLNPKPAISFAAS
jgi:acetyltransferase-like isoleucine patch superfamily enzyme